MKHVIPLALTSVVLAGCAATTEQRITDIEIGVTAAQDTLADAIDADLITDRDTLVALRYLTLRVNGLLDSANAALAQGEELDAKFYARQAISALRELEAYIVGGAQ